MNVRWLIVFFYGRLSWFVGPAQDPISAIFVHTRWVELFTVSFFALFVPATLGSPVEERHLN